MKRSALLRNAFALLISFELIAAAAAQEKVSADTPRVTPGGATFTLPKEWTITSGKDMVVLQPPETDTHIAIVDSNAPDANSAVAGAWRRTSRSRSVRSNW